MYVIYYICNLPHKFVTRKKKQHILTKSRLILKLFCFKILKTLYFRKHNKIFFMVIFSQPNNKKLTEIFSNRYQVNILYL